MLVRVTESSTTAAAETAAFSKVRNAFPLSRSPTLFHRLVCRNSPAEGNKTNRPRITCRRPPSLFALHQMASGGEVGFVLGGTESSLIRCRWVYGAVRSGVRAAAEMIQRERLSVA